MQNKISTSFFFHFWSFLPLPMAPQELLIEARTQSINQSSERSS